MLIVRIGSLQRYNLVTVTLFRVPSFHACGYEGAAELLHADCLLYTSDAADE